MEGLDTLIATMGDGDELLVHMIGDVINTYLAEKAKHGDLQEFPFFVIPDSLAEVAPVV